MSTEKPSGLKVWTDGVHTTIAVDAEDHCFLRPTSPKDDGFASEAEAVEESGVWEHPIQLAPTAEVAVWCEPGTFDPCEPYSGCLVTMSAEHWALARGRRMYLCSVAEAT